MRARGGSSSAMDFLVGATAPGAALAAFAFLWMVLDDIRADVHAIRLVIEASEAFEAPGEAGPPAAGPGDVALLADMMCSECAACSPEERKAVAVVALDRLRMGRWGTTLEEVIRADGQFAFGSPQCDSTPPPRPDGLPWSQGWLARHGEVLASIRREAGEVLLADPAERPWATHFHASWLGDGIWPEMRELPVPAGWLHRFYRER